MDSNKNEKYKSAKTLNCVMIISKIKSKIKLFNT